MKCHDVSWSPTRQTGLSIAFFVIRLSPWSPIFGRNPPFSARRLQPARTGLRIVSQMMHLGQPHGRSVGAAPRRSGFAGVMKCHDPRPFSPLRPRPSFRPERTPVREVESRLRHTVRAIPGSSRDTFTRWRSVGMMGSRVGAGVRKCHDPSGNVMATSILPNPSYRLEPRTRSGAERRYLSGTTPLTGHRGRRISSTSPRITSGAAVEMTGESESAARRSWLRCSYNVLIRAVKDFSVRLSRPGDSPAPAAFDYLYPYCSIPVSCGTSGRPSTAAGWTPEPPKTDPQLPANPAPRRTPARPAARLAARLAAGRCVWRAASAGSWRPKATAR